MPMAAAGALPKTLLCNRCAAYSALPALCTSQAPRLLLFPSGNIGRCHIVIEFADRSVAPDELATFPFDVNIYPFKTRCREPFFYLFGRNRSRNATRICRYIPFQILGKRRNRHHIGDGKTPTVFQDPKCFAVNPPLIR